MSNSDSYPNCLYRLLYTETINKKIHLDVRNDPPNGFCVILLQRYRELCFTSHFYDLYRYHYQRQRVSESGILNCKTYIPNHYRYDNPYSHAIYRTNDWGYFPHLSTFFHTSPIISFFSTPLLICILSFQHFFISYWYILCIDFIANVFLNLSLIHI